MNRLPLFVSFLLGCFFYTLDAQNIPSSGKGHSAIENGVDQIVKHAMGDIIPGMTVAISKNGKMVYSKGFGYANYGTKTKMKPTHRTGIGSVSKVITALAIMKLTQQNASFTLDRKLYFNRGILPGRKYRDAINQGAAKHNVPLDWYKAMTVKHLLTHTVGYKWSGDTQGARNHFGIGANEDLPYSKYHQFMLMEKRVLHEPGRDHYYSNHAVGLCALIIEKMTGKSYGRYVNRNIFRPLNLNGKIVPRKHYRDEFDAHRHELVNGKIEPMGWDFNANPIDNVSAAGGWAASAQSLIRLMLATDKLENHRDILKPETIDLMEDRHFPNVDGAHAIGWGVSSNGKRLSHSGSMPGYKTYIIKYRPNSTRINGIDPSGINIAICANIRADGMGSLSALARDIAIWVASATIPDSYDLLAARRTNPK